jgi:L-ribulose-5-phosphate 4-epimerase
MGAFDDGKRQVLLAAQQMVRLGLLVGTGGNVSVRLGDEDRVAITPSQRDYDDLSVDDICVVDFDGTQVEGTSAPSVETGMHVAVYRARPDVNAILHTHQPHGSVFALLNEPIPALTDEQVANLGDSVAVVPYGLSGSQDLLENIAAAVGSKCNAYALQNHGVLLLALDLPRAVRNALLLEKTAHAYQMALATGHPVGRLDPEVTAAVFDLLKTDQRAEARRRRKAREAAGKA